MNKTELIAAVAEKAELSKKDAEAAVTAAIDVITESLRQGEKVQLVGFGSFEVKTRAERMGRNPQTKEPHPGLQGAGIQGWQGFEGRSRPLPDWDMQRAPLRGALHFLEEEYAFRQVVKSFPTHQAPHRGQ